MIPVIRPAASGGSDAALLVIVPITRFGAFPEAAVASLLPLGGAVRVLASFNRPIDPQRDATLLGLLQQCRAQVIHPPRLLSPSAHFLYIVQQARRALRVSFAMPCVVVCDDDRLLLNPQDLQTIAGSVRRGVAVWGPFLIERTGEPETSIHQAFFQSPTRTVHSRLERLSDEMAFAQLGYRCEPAVFASITGLFAPFAAFFNAAWFLRLTLAHHGARAEVLTLARRNLAVTTHVTPVAAITFHPSQAGLVVRELSHLRSEIRFRAYALLNSASLQEAWALMHLGFNPRWFWRAGVSLCLKASRRALRRVAR